MLHPQRETTLKIQHSISSTKAENINEAKGKKTKMKLKVENENETKGRRRNKNEIAIGSRKWKNEFT